MDEKEKLIQEILEKDKDLKGSNIDENLMHDLLAGRITKNINDVHNEKSTFGQRVADKVASFGGSWTFIIGFCLLIAVWIILNTLILVNGYDPYPFTFLNLILSCVAAIQAPVVMMSQNRQSEKDRLTASNDYLTNLKSEIIIEDLHNKLDSLMNQQQENTKTIESLLETIKIDVDKN